MKLLLLRQKTITNNTLRGILFIDGNFECFTLENFEKRIPEGLYPFDIYHSPKFSRRVLLLRDVPGREFIEIHPANLADELIGCIAPGVAAQDNKVFNSRIALDKILKQVNAVPKIEALEIEVASL